MPSPNLHDTDDEGTKFQNMANYLPQQHSITSQKAWIFRKKLLYGDILNTVTRNSNKF